MARSCFNMLALQRLNAGADGGLSTRVSHSFNAPRAPALGYLSFLAAKAFAPRDAAQLVYLRASALRHAEGNAEASLRVEKLHSSPLTSSLLAKLSQGGVCRAIFTGVCASEPQPSTSNHQPSTSHRQPSASQHELQIFQEGQVVGEAPKLPSPSTCLSATPCLRESFGERLWSEVELRVPPQSEFATYFLEGKASGKPVIEGWLGFAQPFPIDLHHLTFFGAVCPSPILNSLGSSARTTSLEYSIHLRRAPPINSLRVRGIGCPSCLLRTREA